MWFARDVQLANDRQRLVVAENDRRRAGLNLMRAMGLKMDATVVLTDKLAYRRRMSGRSKTRWPTRARCGRS